jgi:methionine sulfoxide reductase heme-binding subunit
MNFLDLSSTIGLIAAVVLTINLLIGMLVSIHYRKLALWKKMPLLIRRVKLFEIHNWTAYLALLLAAIHPLLLLFDASAKFSFLDIIFPIHAPTQRVYVAMGTISFLAILIIIITSQEIVRKKLGFRTWKNIHLSTYAIALLFLVHGVVMDPELKNRTPDFFDGEKLLSETCLIVLVAAGILRFRYHQRQRR